MTRIETVLACLPAEIVVTDPDIIAPFMTDFRKQYTGRAKAVLRPRSVEEVQQIVRTCASHGVALVPQGGNTSYCTAATPDADESQLLISLDRMSRLRDIDIANLSVTVDAGMVLSVLQDAADEADLMMPLALGSQESCRIGGNLSTNAGGINVVRYGMARDLVLGLEVVLPDGTLFSDLRPLRKNNAGYDVKQLFLGAEGTLGIITGASLKLVRKPRQVFTAFLAIKDIDSLARLLDAAQVATGGMISCFEYLSDPSLSLLLAARPELRFPLGARSDHYVLLEAATASPSLNLEEVLNGFLETLWGEGEILDGTLAASDQQRAEFWHLRESIPEAEVHHGGSIKHDIAVRTSRLAAFILEASSLVHQAAPEAVLSIYGHVGDGNVHFNILAPAGQVASAFKTDIQTRVSPMIYALAMAMEGTFSAEYGIGRTNLALLERYASPGKLALMRALKQALDPHDLMNPGKVLPAQREADQQA
ncbi:FAD-binding oxidoreductase [Arenibacterium sp. LLYu02]|uniref:FAD-binding oxidoreductase n=1 Tax=Arenibacterium sp. LLYu02 TaxID=3404132 RepID=UPI003B20DAAB